MVSSHTTVLTSTFLEPAVVGTGAKDSIAVGL